MVVTKVIEVVTDNIKYPPVMVSVGLKDEQVSPWQSAKFAARLNDINQLQEEGTLIIADEGEEHFFIIFSVRLLFYLENKLTTVMFVYDNTNNRNKYLILLYSPNKNLILACLNFHFNQKNNIKEYNITLLYPCLQK